MNKLYIVRHGETDWNAKGLCQGSMDIELNNVGIKQAKELSLNIDLSKIDICISSPLKRTKETALILTNNMIDIIYDDLLIERSFGNYEGMEINADLINSMWDYKFNDSSNNMESIQECLLRANKFLEKIKEKYPNKTILLVSHGCFIKALHFNLVGYNENTDFCSFFPKNATLYEYELD